jgi:NAD(P)-dependent dehydrogenase (short-subunit alcohol dehydrogenase family)
VPTTDAAEADALWTKVAAKRLPLGRSVEPDDVGQAVVYLCGAGAVTGVALPVTGGEGMR